MTLPFPAIEGLSGSPVIAFHNGPKVVGMCFGSESQRVLAQEITEVEEGERKYVETTNRIVEFGLANRVEVIELFCAEVGVQAIFSTQPEIEVKPNVLP